MDSLNRHLAEEMKWMKEGFDSLKSDICVTKNVDKLLSEHFINMERQWWEYVQYSRREYL